MELEPILRSIIKAVVHPLKSGTKLEIALKAKLTKKELKLLKMLALKEEPSIIKTTLKFDDKELERVEKNLLKKLNQEQTKQAIYDI